LFNMVQELNKSELGKHEKGHWIFA
jgi:hypothetical protein